MAPPDERRRAPRPGNARPKMFARRDCIHGQCAPSTFSLTSAELATHALELLANGWTEREIREVLDLGEVWT